MGYGYPDTSGSGGGLPETPLAVVHGGTGSTTAAGAKTNLTAAGSGVNADITQITGLTTALADSEGGTGLKQGTDFGTANAQNMLFVNSTGHIAVAQGPLIGARTIAVNTNLTAQDNDVIECNVAAGPITVTLPVVAAANVGKIFCIRKISSPDANAITVNAAGGALIDNAATFVLNSPFDTCWFRAADTTSNYHTVSQANHVNTSGVIQAVNGGTGLRGGAGGADYNAANFKNMFMVAASGSPTIIQGPFVGAHGTNGNEAQQDQGDDQVQVNAGGGAVTISLPTIRAQNVGKIFVVRRAGNDVSGNQIIITVPGGGSLNNGGVASWTLFGNQEAAMFVGLTTAGDYMIYNTANRFKQVSQVPFGGGLANGDLVNSLTYRNSVAFGKVGTITKISIAANVVPIGGVNSVTIQKNGVSAVIASFDPTTIGAANTSQALAITGNAQLNATDTILVTWTTGIQVTACRAPVVSIELSHGE